ncbi:uncharacterized protein LOC130667326 [Microplitis mediator]|uniref:uncharacterized protein LOC130667326 n=1 Tax=Microplitis mediator TaxID=375433 RepID=UPI002556CE4F|nr:uncharacterized protein LOC130667326 [Microplitis mediator]
MCATGCFPLAKWASNSTKLLSQVTPVETQEDTLRDLGDTTVKVVGLTWNSTQDKFQFGYSLPEASPTTKRIILSEITHLFDPLGFLVPIFVRAKMFMQKLWLQNFDWDATLSPVTKIQKSLSSVNWDFIPVNLNPADCASRALTAVKLEQHSLWWTGPKWLSQSKENWPFFDIPTQTVSHLEERPGLGFTIFKADSHLLHTLLDEFSKLSPLLRTLGICLRAIAKFEQVPQSTLATPLSTVDLKLTKTLLIKYTPKQYYSQELKLLKDGDSLQRNHRLAELIPYVDYNRVLRVGGRVKNSLLDDDQKNPAILPRSSRLSTLLIDHSHHRTFHGRTQFTLADLRRFVWIEGGRVPVRSHILRCVVCTRHRGVRA